MSHSGYISDILLPFSRRTHRVRTAKMSLYIKNLSQNSSFNRFREYIFRRLAKMRKSVCCVLHDTHPVARMPRTFVSVLADLFL